VVSPLSSWVGSCGRCRCSSQSCPWLVPGTLFRPRSGWTPAPRLLFKTGIAHPPAALLSSSPPPLCRYGAVEALSRAAADGMHWLLHLDPDELLHPGGWVREETACSVAQCHHPST
jgi:hypothetical protein